MQAQKWRVLNLYSPTTGNEHVHFYEKIYNLINDNKTKEMLLLVGGDFNVVRNVNADKKKGTKKEKMRILEILDRIMEDHNLTDIWWAKNPWKKQFTWKGQGVECRLDMWLVSNSLISVTKFSTIMGEQKMNKKGIRVQSKIMVGLNTDHKAVMLSLQGEHLKE